MDKTKIQWTDATWNPLRGCSRVSAGCMNCYAEKQAARFSYNGVGHHAGSSDTEEKAPGQYNGLIRDGKWNGQVRLIEDRLLDPLRWKKPRKIFVNSMSDLFHENIPDEWIDRIFAVMALAPQHTFQVLTKRPERMMEYLQRLCCDEFYYERLICELENLNLEDRCEWLSEQSVPFANVWLGVSVEDQKSAEERIPLLLQTPAAIRFVSYEPALGPVDFSYHGAKGLAVYREAETVREQVGSGRYPWQIFNRPGRGMVRFGGSQLDWIIVGGESGSGARRFDPAWARSVVRQCKTASVPVFVKQMGSDAQTSHETLAPGEDPYWTKFLNRKGDDPAQWPEDLRVREFPRCSSQERPGSVLWPR